MLCFATVVGLRSISEISSCFLGPRPLHIEIRHRVKKSSTINLFGFETLKLKIRRLKSWKPTVLLSWTDKSSDVRAESPGGLIQQTIYIRKPTYLFSKPYCCRLVCP